MPRCEWLIFKQFDNIGITSLNCSCISTKDQNDKITFCTGVGHFTSSDDSYSRVRFGFWKWIRRPKPPKSNIQRKASFSGCKEPDVFNTFCIYLAAMSRHLFKIWSLCLVRLSVYSWKHLQNKSGSETHDAVSRGKELDPL